MLPAWMLYATAIGALAFVVALALEHLLGIWSLPRRMAWVLAMAVTVALPIWLTTRTPPRARTVGGGLREVPVTGASARAIPSRSMAPVVPWRLRVMRWSRRFDRQTRTIWIAGSTAVGLVFVAAYVSLLRRRRTWREGTLHGHRVLLTGDVGPAVVGFLQPRIVIPEWALALPNAERRLMLDHELEHLSGNDPKLLLFAAFVLMLFPWNAALWLMTRRLRVAIEIDCDARVVRGTDAADEYGLFLIAVGERRVQGLFLAASLAERRSSLERRIYAMTSLRPKYPILASLPFAAIALGATLLAAQTPTPPGAGGGVIARMSQRDTAMTGAVNGLRLSNDDVRAIIARHLPAVANGTSDANVVSIVMGPTGEVVVTGATRLTETPVTGASGGTIAVRALQAPSAVGVERAEGRNRPDTAANPALRLMNVPGVGRIDRSLITGMSMARYAAGEVSGQAITLRIVRISGSSISGSR